MSNISFRKTRGGNYSAEYQRNDGFGYETRYYHPAELAATAGRHEADLNWLDEDSGHGDDMTMAELIILTASPRPFRVTS